MSNKKIRVCIIEDELQTRKALIEKINESKEMQVVCSDEYVDSSIEKIINNNLDLIFMDIKLRGGDAFMILEELIKQGRPIPPVVINTGFTKFEYAKKVFNEYKNIVIWILEKPFFEGWDKKETHILKEYYKTIYRKNTIVKKDKILIKTRFKTHIIPISEILILRIPDDYKGLGKTNIITKEKNYFVNKTLVVLEDELPSFFIRINRYEIINGKYISEYYHGEQLINLSGYKRSLNVGTAYKDSVIRYVEII